MVEPDRVVSGVRASPAIGSVTFRCLIASTTGSRSPFLAASSEGRLSSPILSIARLTTRGLLRIRVWVGM